MKRASGNSFCTVLSILVWITTLDVSIVVTAFQPSPCRPRATHSTTVLLLDSSNNENKNDDNSNNNKSNMKRPLMDRFASTLFQLEQDRVAASSVVDEQGRVGEPMEWSESNSWANQFSQLMASGPGYALKQWVADIVAGSNYNATQISQEVDAFVNQHTVAMYSFTTCPFCRRAKDYLQAQNIPFHAIELDERKGNKGNEIRAVLGRKTKRTSVPAIFIGGKFIGGCNDGPGLLTLAERGELMPLIERAQTRKR
jgi:glutaredoxin 3